MNDAAIAEPVVVTPPAPVADIQEPVIPADDANLATHETAFGKDGTAKGRHRAKSQQAASGDAPRIAELTKKYRTAEQERDDWRAKYEAATRTAPAVPAAPPLPVVEPPKPATLTATRPKPTEDMIGTTYQSYTDMVEDLNDWKDEQREAAREQKRQETAAKEQAAQRTAAASKAAQSMESAYRARLTTFVETHPDFDERLKAIELPAPDVMVAALKKLDNGPEVVYALTARPDLWAEMHLIGDGKPVTDLTVAAAQRWLMSRLQAVNTPSAATTPRTAILPTPPNGVRTGPLTPSDEPPGDGASLAEHERHFGAKSRR